MSYTSINLFSNILSSAPKDQNLIMFDTEYYHYPAIKFISKFGIETEWIFL